MALVLGSGGQYAPAQVELTTVEDITRLKGTLGEIRGGAQVRVSSADPLLATDNGNLSDEELRRVFVKDDGHSPSVNYVESGGVLFPNDFDSWNLVSTYFNFEQALLYFISLGDSESSLQGSLIYYFPDFKFLDQSRNSLKDNAFYYSPIQAFAILPFESLQAVPLSMNMGVIAHEFAHQVFNRRVFGGQAIPEAFKLWGSSIAVGATPQINLLRSLDEGLADYHGFGTTCRSPFGCDPRFLQTSLSEEETNKRDISKTHCMSDGLRLALNSNSVSTFTDLGLEYEVGSIIANAYFEAAGAKPENHAFFQSSVLTGYDALRSFIDTNLTQPSRLTLGAMMDPFLQAVESPELRANLCTQFLTRLQIPRNDLPSCPASSVVTNACPTLVQ